MIDQLPKLKNPLPMPKVKPTRKSLPRIRPKRLFGISRLSFECQGIHPETGFECWGYGPSIRDAYQNWLDDALPF